MDTPASCNQVGGVSGTGKHVVRLAGATDAIDHDAHAANPKVGVVGLGDRLDDRHHASRKRVVIPYRNEFRVFPRFDPPLQLVAPVQIRGGIKLEALRVPVAGRRRHLHDGEAPRQCSGRQRRDLGERLREGNAQVHFVEDHEAVVTGEPGVHRPHTRRYTVAAEQQPRAELIHGRHHDPRLIRVACPLMVHGNPTAQGGDSERRSRVAEGAQPLADAMQDWRFSGRDPVSDAFCPLTDLVDDDAPVDDEYDASWRRRRTSGHDEHGGIEYRCLAGAGRQIDDLRPDSPVEYLCRQPALPRKRRIPVYVTEERGEIVGSEFVNHCGVSGCRFEAVSDSAISVNSTPSPIRSIPARVSGASTPIPETGPIRASVDRQRVRRTSTTREPTGVLRACGHARSG